jgi:hypothetical protein
MIVVRYRMNGVVSVNGYTYSERVALQRVARAKAARLKGGEEIADYEIIRLR